MTHGRACYAFCNYQGDPSLVPRNRDDDGVVAAEVVQARDGILHTPFPHLAPLIVVFTLLE